MKAEQLKQLKALSKQLQLEQVARPATPTTSPPPSERELWKQATQGVSPLGITSSPSASQRKSCPPFPRPTAQLDEEVIKDNVSDYWPWHELEANETLLFSRPGIRLDTLRKLKRGHWPAQAVLDLHNHTIDTARVAVIEFIHRQQSRHLQHLRIIHGKGLSSVAQQPILKLKLKNWLIQLPSVLAFAQAPLHDGGAGAVSVLIARKADHR